MVSSGVFTGNLYGRCYLFSEITEAKKEVLVFLPADNREHEYLSN